MNGGLFLWESKLSPPRFLMSICRRSLALQGQLEIQLVAAWIWEITPAVSNFRGRSPVPGTGP